MDRKKVSGKGEPFFPIEASILKRPDPGLPSDTKSRDLNVMRSWACVPAGILRQGRARFLYRIKRWREKHEFSLYTLGPLGEL